jgi:hypothetical protein
MQKPFISMDIVGIYRYGVAGENKLCVYLQQDYVTARTIGHLMPILNRETTGHAVLLT